MIKLEEIKSKLKNRFDLSAKLGVVISGFDENNNLLFTNGIIFTDETLQVNLKNLYDQFILPNKKIKTLVVDVITSTKEITSTQELKNIDLLNEGIFVGDTKTNNGAFILPNTEKVDNIAKAIKAIKEIGKIESKNVNVYSFKTKRIVV